MPFLLDTKKRLFVYMLTLHLFSRGQQNVILVQPYQFYEHCSP